MTSKTSRLISKIIFGAIGLAIGLAICFWGNLMVNLLLVVFGVLTILSAAPRIVDAIKGISEKNKMSVFDLIIAIISLTIGIMLIFSQNKILTIIIGVYLLVLPIIRVLVSRDKPSQLKKELFSMAIGLVLLFFGPSAIVDFFFWLTGALVIALSALYIVFGIVGFFKQSRAQSKHIVGTRIFADTNGDGNIDTVYVDSDGDGKHDAEIKINTDKESE